MINNVLYVSQLRNNLLSAGKIKQNGLKIISGDGKAEIHGKDSPIALGWRKGTLYEIVFNIQSDELNALITEQENNRLWHHRLRHINYQYHNQLCSMVDGLKLSMAINHENFCHTCVSAKQNR